MLALKAMDISGLFYLIKKIERGMPALSVH